MTDILIIVNPVSAGGSTGRRWPAVQRKLRARGFEFEVALTTKPLEATEIARREVRGSRPLVVAAGGDGTINEVVNGFFDEDRPQRSDTRLGVLPLGTGGDFRRTFGIPDDPVRAARFLLVGTPRRIDAGCARFRTRAGEDQMRHFINIADAGVGGEVVERVNRSRKRLGGRATFLAASLVSIARWQNKEMRLTVDGEMRELTAQQVVVANGQYYGSGMRVAPGAMPDDGLFDVVVVGDVNLVENLRGLAKIRSGKHLEGSNPKWEVLRGRKVSVASPEPVRIDLDGEQPGVLPATFELVPAAITLMCP
jgi:YegS/Rv2252/BmrU family lipid kinase